VPIAIKTSGSFNKTGLEFITELGNRLKLVTGDKLELTYLFQRLSIAIKRGNDVCFNDTMCHVDIVRLLCSELSLSLSLHLSLILSSLLLLFCMRVQYFSIITIIIRVAQLSILNEDEWGDLECLYKACQAAMTNADLITYTGVHERGKN